METYNIPQYIVLVFLISNIWLAYVSDGKPVVSNWKHEVALTFVAFVVLYAGGFFKSLFGG